MKKMLLLLVGAIGMSYSLPAQNCAPNGITTNPAAPVNNQRPAKLNTFDWTQPSYPLNTTFTPRTLRRLTPPFFTTDNPNITNLYDPNDGIKDMAPDQGWELIKRDFGYNDQGQPNNPGTTNPYLLLYNKYRGVLQVLIARVENNSYNGANIEIAFDDFTPMQTSLLDHNADLKAINGFFTSNPSLSSVPDFLNLPLKWSYADFPMAYAPCTCLYSSKLNVNITLSSTSNVVGTTTTTGSITSDDLADNGVPTTSQKRRGEFAIGKATSSAKKVTQAYKSSYMFERDIKPALKKENGTDDNDKKNDLTQFGQAIAQSDFLKAGLGAIPYVGDALSLIDFFVGGGKKANAPQQVEIMPMTMNMTGKYTGQIATTYPYNGFSFRTPGSNTSGAPDSEYPYYNETMGIFNLLRTPELEIRYFDVELGGGPFNPTIYQQQIFMKLADQLEYVVNPASGLEVQRIQASLVSWDLKDLNGGALGTDVFYEGRDIKLGRQYHTRYLGAGCWSGSLYQLFRSTTSAQTINSWGKWRIKVMVDLKRIDATANTQNVLFVATYPVTLDIVKLSSPEDITPWAGNLPGCGGLVPAVSFSAANSFCNTGEYKTAQRGFLRYEENLQKMEEEERLQASLPPNVLPTVGSQHLAIYPNPVTDIFTLEYTVPVAGSVKITLRGGFASQVEVLVEETQHEAGTFRVAVDGSSYPPGVYFCTLETESQRTVKKTIIR